MNQKALNGVIENAHMRIRRRCIYTAGADFDFLFDEKDFPQVQELWRLGLPGKIIAVRMNRAEIEMRVLIADLLANKLLAPRPGMFDGLHQIHVRRVVSEARTGRQLSLNV